jgi:hypothetical protein
MSQKPDNRFPIGIGRHCVAPSSRDRAGEGPQANRRGARAGGPEARRFAAPGSNQRSWCPTRPTRRRRPGSNRPSRRRQLQPSIGESRTAPCDEPCTQSRLMAVPYQAGRRPRSKKPNEPGVPQVYGIKGGNDWSLPRNPVRSNALERGPDAPVHRVLPRSGLRAPRQQRQGDPGAGGGTPDRRQRARRRASDCQREQKTKRTRGTANDWNIRSLDA